MESTESTLHCSFVIYLAQDEAVLPAFLRDLQAFFQKFPLQYELIVALEKEAVACEKLLESHRKSLDSKASLVLLKNKSKRQRAESLREALRQAKAHRILILSPEMSTPLGDSFKILQNLLTDPQLEVCWGERYSKPVHSIENKMSVRLKLENLFNKIFQEKNKIPSGDWLCEIGGLSKNAWEKIDQRHSAKISGWYLAPLIHGATQRLSLSCENVFVHDSGEIVPSFSAWRIRLLLLRQSLFQRF